MTWTFVAGSMNLDCLRVLGHKDCSVVEFAKSTPLGRSFSSDPVLNDVIHTEFIDISSASCSNNLVVVFWGSLRQFGGIEVQKNLIPYFKDLIESLPSHGIVIRAMAIEMKIRGEPFSYVMTCGDGDKAILTIVEDEHGS